MSLMCTPHDRFAWNLWRRRKRPNIYVPLWIRWYHWKTSGEQSLRCHRPKAGSTSVPNCRESLKSSKTVTVIMHIKCVHLRWSQWYRNCHPEVWKLSCNKSDNSCWCYLPCNGVSFPLHRANALQSFNLCVLSRQITVALLPKPVVIRFKYHMTQ